uniref:Minor capsid protein P9 transmembrane helices domain-containing protein n=1 Tax=viral metagenome TaxID=1070528 RepID=A0A6C0CX83_9ZZZZ
MTNFWFNDMNIILNRSYITEVIPNNNYEVNRNMNAIFRASLYLSLVIFLLNKKTNIFALPLIIAVITIMVHKNNINIQEKIILLNKNENKNEITINKENNNNNIINKLKEKLRFPTINNPLMNLNLVDHDNKIAVNPNNQLVKDDINKNLDINVYRDPSDTNYESFNRFYTMPVTSIINDQKGFAEWCYSGDSGCKYGNQKDCYKKRGRSGGSTGGGFGPS